jgi:hypothetical protein
METITQLIHKRINIETFDEAYKPRKNHLVEGAPFGGWMYETFGKEYEFVKAQPDNTIWTVLDVEGGTIISQGWHFVNRLGYIITEIPHTPDTDIEVIDDDDVRIYYSYHRIKENATGKYLKVGYNDYGTNMIMWSWAEDHLKLEDPNQFCDENSEYHFEDILKEQGYTLETSEEMFSAFENFKPVR